MRRITRSSTPTIHADWAHDGSKTAGPPPSGGFLIVPLAAPTAVPTLSPIRVSPVSGPVEVSVDTEAARSRVRLFTRAPDGDWMDLGTGGPWQITPSGDAVEFALSASPATGMYRPTLPNEFTLALHTGSNILTIPCRIAPVLLASSLDPVEEVLVVRNRHTDRFAAELKRRLAKADGTPRLHFIDHASANTDIWMQDAVEVGVSPTPEPGGGVSQQLAPLLGIRARHEMGLVCGPLDKLARWHFESDHPDAVLIEPALPRGGSRWIDWYGNLEVSPPVPGFPFGRILTGEQRGLGIHPDLLAFLEAQRAQWPPLVLDVSWLTIGHVDETINFVPAPDRLGFRALLPSPALARRILEETIAAGHGDAPVFPGSSGETTAARLLEEVARSRESERVEAALRETRTRLRGGLGLEDADIVEMPTLFRNGLAVIPNGVNSLVVGRDVFLPDPVGPAVGGVDRFQQAIAERLTRLGLRLHVLNVWEPYHSRSGEIHCGTNAVRRLRRPEWWRSPDGPRRPVG